MYHLFIHDDAEDDLEQLFDDDSETAARIVALLQELEGSQDLLDRLTKRHFGAYQTEDFHVDEWVDQQRRGRNIWRIKIWDLEDKGIRYRIVYAFVPNKHHYHVLAIAPRGFDYDAKDPISQRIITAYEDL